MTTAPPAGAKDARAQIAVSVWQPQPYDESGDGPALVRVHVEEMFEGDIRGSGIATFLQALRGDGSATFCGLERVVGEIEGRSGSFVLQDSGTLDEAGNVTGSWFVVADSGTGALRGLRGEGGFSAAVGQRADARLRYWFE